MCMTYSEAAAESFTTAAYAEPTQEDLDWYMNEVYGDPWDGMDAWLEATYDPDL